MKHRILSIAALATAMFAGTASAQIFIAGTANGTYDSSAITTATISYSLQGAGNALVFGTYVDSGAFVGSNPQFAGSSASGSIQDQRVFLAYFFNPAASGDITFSVTGGNVNSAYFIYELNGVNTSALANTGTGAAITTTTDNRFIVDFIGANNTDGSGPLVPAGLQTLSGLANANGAIGGGTVGASYVSNAGAAGSKTLGWSGFGGGFANGEASLAFSAVPEPSIFAFLIGSAGAMVIARRRKV